ncbi:MAG: ABC transporter ATP-binding protein [Clostridiales bacterium]|nr:ABC transporter ATP-binding protein [Clostridiales bacterium]
MSKIKIKNLTKYYGKNLAIDDISLEITENKIYGLLGRNGAGKTTLLNLITNKLFPTNGEILIDSENIFENERVLSQIYYMSEKNLYPETMKVKEIIKWTKDFYPNFDLDYAYKLSDKFNLNLKSKFKALSTGYASIFKIILTLSSRAPILLFDEPILGLDANHRDMFYKELINYYSVTPTTVIISTHLIEEVSDIIEEVLIIKDGKLILSDTTENILFSGYTVSGKAEDVDAFNKDKKVIGEDNIGKFKSAYILGPIPSKEDPYLNASNLEISKLDLQKMFIQLTNS